MRASKYEIIIALIVLLSFAISGYFYPQMPDKMASHWNAQGQVDGYTSRLWGLFLVPLLLVGMSLLFIAIPRIDPLRANIEKFKKHYYGFIMLVLLFMFYV
ncbi:MAG: DUF1648 domain-containing protein, partial [Chloroflexi bacterium]|nr:DUF1648 domain-containing protein [Chloroflexota bacterium]